MATFGPFNFEVTSNSAKPKIGQLTLTYTLDPSTGAISDASIDYTPPTGNGNDTEFDVTFTGTAAPYTGTPTTQPIANGWNVPGEGSFKYATFSFTPPVSGNTGSFTGEASKTVLGGDVNDITWESDPSVSLPEGERHRHHQTGH